MDIFDREFTLRFPGIVFARHIHYVFISTSVNDKVHFDEKVGYAFMEEVAFFDDSCRRAGEIVSIILDLVIS
jgi:hypothetical protein